MAAPLLAALLRCSEGAAAATVLQRALPPLGARLADAAAPRAARDDAQRALLALLQTLVSIDEDANGVAAGPSGATGAVAAAGAALRPHSAALLRAAREVATRGLGGGGGGSSGGGHGGPVPNAATAGTTPYLVSPPAETLLEALQAEPDRATA